jgi:hypothetical protein
MRTFIQRSILYFLVAWLFVSSVGLSWTQSTCVFTGVQKSSWSSKVRCCQNSKSGGNSGKSFLSRASCCHHKHFQVKQQVSVFQKKESQIISSVTFFSREAFSHAIINWLIVKVDYRQLPQPLHPSSRRAYLQIYLI